MTDARESLLRNFLQKIATDLEYDNPDIKTSAVPTTGSNFTSQLFHATIKSADKEDLNVFSKVLVVGEKLREQAGATNFFNIEPEFYTKLAETYKEIEDKHDVPEEHRLVLPKFYGSSDEYLKELVVMQDLSKDGYVTFDRLKSIDWDYASAAVEEMAKFHALSVAHQIEYPEDYEEAKKVFQRPMMEENSEMTEIFKKSLEKTIQIVREENIEKVQKFFFGTFDDQSFMKFYKPMKRPVIIHSDFRQSNLMHKVDEYCVIVPTMTAVRETLLRNLLQNIANDLKYDKPDIVTEAVPATGANFTTQLFHASIKSSVKEDLNIFAKVAATGEVMREQAGFNMFEVEKYFYTKLAERYKEIEDKHNIPEEHRLIMPKFYGYSGEFLKEVLVLQDLSKDGFVTYDRLKSVDWEYASKAIEEIAKYHALSIAHQKEYPECYEEATRLLVRTILEENSPVMEVFQKTFMQVVQMAREENRKNLQRFFSKTLTPKKLMNFYKPKRRPVIVHSDYRQSNLMHKIDENGKLQIVVVDYQTLHPGSVALDLLYFIFTGSDGAFRAQYYDQLIEHYYENLAKALRRLDLDPEEAFPRAVFDEELKDMLPFGLMISSMLLPLITIDLVHVTKGKDGEFENESFEVMADMMSKANELCAQRLNEVVDDYVKWGII